MRSILDEIKPKTAALIAEKARAQGLSVDDYLTNLLTASQPSRTAPLTLGEIDQILDELSQGTESPPPLPDKYSGEDIYFDHD
jgi:hypothetical protein